MGKDNKCLSCKAYRTRLNKVDKELKEAKGTAISSIYVTELKKQIKILKFDREGQSAQIRNLEKQLLLKEANIQRLENAVRARGLV